MPPHGVCLLQFWRMPYAATAWRSHLFFGLVRENAATPSLVAEELPSALTPRSVARSVGPLRHFGKSQDGARGKAAGISGAAAGKLGQGPATEYGLEASCPAGPPQA